MEYELYNQVTWTPSPSANISDYFVYRDGNKIAQLNAATLTYKDHNRKKGTAYIYSITAFDASGNESSSVNIVIKP